MPFARFCAMNALQNCKRYHIAKVFRRYMAKQATLDSEILVSNSLAEISRPCPRAA